MLIFQIILWFTQIKEVFNKFFALSKPFGKQVRWTDREKSGVSGFGCNCLSQKGFTSARWSVKENTVPWLSFTREQMWKFNW